MMPCFSRFAILLQGPERWNFRCQKDIISVIWWWGEERISERLLENDSLCYLSPDFTADSYQEERDLTVHQPKEEICESDFPPPPSSLSSPKLLLPPFQKKKKWKRIKLLSLSPNKHKLFWHLINRQYSIVPRARQVCLPHSWWIPLFCMESLLAFLSNVVTHLSPVRGRFERWPKVITQSRPRCCRHAFSPTHHH